MLRTLDVTSGAESFEELLLPAWVLKALHSKGYQRPSPVQTIAIPAGRLGADLIVQAKAGTGKTLVFAIVCLERLDPNLGMPQALVLAPAREIALQSAEVLSAIAAHMPSADVCIGTLIGGLPIIEDQKLLRRRCHVTVGTPGRLGKLLELGSLVLERCGLIVLDEADFLLSESFAGTVRQIMDAAPAKKQVLALSATYSPDALQTLRQIMNQPQHVLLCHSTIALLGIRQYFKEVPHADCEDVLFDSKLEAMLQLLTSIIFNQAMVFTNAPHTAQQAASCVTKAGFPVDHLSAARPQVERMDSVGAVRSFRIRVVVATDVAARGLDLPAVNLVVNLDLPYDGVTYAHRVGRAGRFGTLGRAVTFASASELSRLHAIVQEVEGGKLEPLPDDVSEEAFNTGTWAHHSDDVSLTNSTSPGEQPSDFALPKGSNALNEPLLVWERGQDSDLTSDDHSNFTHSVHSDDGSAASNNVRNDQLQKDSSSALHREFSDEAASSVDDESCSTCTVHQNDCLNEQHVDAVGDPTATFGGIMGASLWHSGLRDQDQSAASSFSSSTVPLAAKDTLAVNNQEVEALAYQSNVSSSVALDYTSNGNGSISGSADGRADAVGQISPVAEPMRDDGNDRVLVSKKLLLRYYQLETFAAEYYEWFMRQAYQQQPQESIDTDEDSILAEVAL